MSLQKNTLHGPGEAERVQFTLDLVKARTPLKGLRVLDLACRTGAFSTAFAKAGANVLGIEGRQDNLDHVPKSTAKYRLMDVRDLPDLGSFDVTLCLGILYHLEAGSAIRLLERMRRTTTRFAIVDTHVGQASDRVAVEGIVFDGQSNGEATSHPWSSIGNQTSWWFTPESLDLAIATAGWMHIEHIEGKGWPGERPDRRWLVLS